jgi:hypothetical protein
MSFVRMLSIGTIWSTSFTGSLYLKNRLLRCVAVARIVKPSAHDRGRLDQRGYLAVERKTRRLCCISL